LAVQQCRLFVLLAAAVLCPLAHREGPEGPFARMVAPAG